MTGYHSLRKYISICIPHQCPALNLILPSFLFSNQYPNRKKEFETYQTFIIVYRTCFHSEIEAQYYNAYLQN